MAIGGVVAPGAAKPEAARGNGPLPGGGGGGGGLMEEMSALLARRYQHSPFRSGALSVDKVNASVLQVQWVIFIFLLH